MKTYFHKMKGAGKSPARVGKYEVFWSWIGAFLGIAAVGLLHEKIFEDMGLIMIIGSFGASAVLLYGAPASPLAQPRNLIAGHFLSALVGVVSFQIFAPIIWLAAAGAVASAIALMHLTKSLHPPGGATALIAVIGGNEVHSLGFMYALVPALSGAVVMLLVALMVNNISASRKYPQFWF